ncbi:mannitol dehydrogenase [Rhodococcus sp. WMMA185]|uniref:mannitol dehydrogenase family protein n=1 Tax=Rhodococcus sp. WMMA185 TaxID=679318 RepID=UPI00087910C6|nr:mannitol dehydrogenase family protein [Rhodococcus sp. WMMA185]AOW92009.1 mannitol dehydrogenase [Rhodococcus sp. WMMA185]
MTGLSRSALARFPASVETPARREDVRIGIVHFGVGNFHRSHEAMYVDRILAAGHTDWGICGVGVMAGDTRMRGVLASQDNLYTLVTRDTDGTAHARVIDSIAEFLYAPDDPEAVLNRLAAPTTRIVSLTITEGGYSINDATGQFDPHDPDTLHDLDDEGVPRSVLGFLTAALARRRSLGIPPFTVVSCDNLEHNGAVARAAVTAFAERKDPTLAAWISDTVAFPSSMVDRITPVTTTETIATVAATFGVEDQWPVQSESFEQWVLEDHFTLGRPPFEQVGVQMVDDVEPYELMKLRLLNASHQVMSYLGILAGYTYVHDVFADPDLDAFVVSYMHREATPTLRRVPGIDLARYCVQLRKRFAGDSIRDTLARQVVNASDRIPKFVLPVAREQLERGGSVDHIALVLAAWCTVVDSEDLGVPLIDGHADELRELARQDRDQPGAFLGNRTIFGDLVTSAPLNAAYRAAKQSLLEQGPRTAARLVTATAGPNP